MKIEKRLVLALNSFTALRSKSYSLSYNSAVQKAERKRIQKPPNVKITNGVCLIPNVRGLQIIQFVQTYIN